jgi:U4/U6 small nuclear ribonucleoprotein PRP3
MDEITIYVEHPVPIKPPGEPDEKPAIAMFLTPKERKKLRKQTRAEREKERQERVLMGIEEAPAPKVKLSNLPRVLGEFLLSYF